MATLCFPPIHCGLATPRWAPLRLGEAASIRAGVGPE